MHREWLSKESVITKKFDSLAVNISRYLFESPHSEEANYFSSTHQLEEKPFLLVLAMLISNCDL